MFSNGTEMMLRDELMQVSGVIPNNLHRTNQGQITHCVFTIGSLFSLTLTSCDNFVACKKGPLYDVIDLGSKRLTVYKFSRRDWLN